MLSASSHSPSGDAMPSSSSPPPPTGSSILYAEHQDNPPPEMVFEGASSPAVSPAPPPTAATAGSASRHATSIFDRVNSPETIGPAYPDEPPPVEPKTPWYQWRPGKMFRIVFIITFLGVTGVVLAVLGAVGKLGNTDLVTSSPYSSLPGQSTMLSSMTPTSTGADTSASTLSTTSAALGTSTSIPPDCSDASKTRQSVAWAGILDANGGWTMQFANSGSPPACCGVCYTATPAGCDFWVFDPDASPTRCTIVSGWRGVRADQQCPAGYTDGTSIQVAGSGKKTAGQGPCGGPISMSGSSGGVRRRGTWI